MCPTCDPFSEPRTFRAPADYVAFARRLTAETSSGKLVLVYGNCALEELDDDSPWPTGDLIIHQLQCVKCGQFFCLHANVWNGRNGWEPQSAEEWADQKHFYIK